MASTSHVFHAQIIHGTKLMFDAAKDAVPFHCAGHAHVIWILAIGVLSSADLDEGQAV
jgi:hypothetical protein